MAIPGLSNHNGLQRLLQQLQQLLASQQDADQCGAQRNDGCFGDDQREFQRIIAELSDKLRELQAFGPEGSGRGNGLNISINT